MSTPVSELLVFVGTYTQTMPHVQGKAEGIYTFRFDRSSGVLTRTALATGIDNPAFVALDPRPAEHD